MQLATGWRRITDTTRDDIRLLPAFYYLLVFPIFPFPFPYCWIGNLIDFSFHVIDVDDMNMVTWLVDIIVLVVVIF